MIIRIILIIGVTIHCALWAMYVSVPGSQTCTHSEHSAAPWSRYYCMIRTSVLGLTWEEWWRRNRKVHKLWQIPTLRQTPNGHHHTESCTNYSEKKITSHSYVWKLELREVEQLAPGHSACKWDPSDSKMHRLSTLLYCQECLLLIINEAMAKSTDKQRLQEFWGAFYHLVQPNLTVKLEAESGTFLYLLQALLLSCGIVVIHIPAWLWK